MTTMHTPSLNAALKRSAFALALALAATAASAQTLGAEVSGTLHNVGSAVGSKIDAAGTAMADTAATAKLKGRISTDSMLEGSKISVKTTNGVALLTGTVSSVEASMAAAKLAADTEGVTSVDNKLTVIGEAATNAHGNSSSASAGAGLAVGTETETSLGAEVSSAARATGKAVTDSWITTKVKSDLLASTATEGSKIHVKTKRGVVYLSGVAKSAAEKDAAIEQASKIEGVTRVSAARLKISAKADASVN